MTTTRRSAVIPRRRRRHRADPPSAWAARRSWNGCSAPTGPPPTGRRQRLEQGPLIGWDEPANHDHVPPGPARPRPGRPGGRSSASPSTAPATGSPPSPSRPGSSRLGYKQEYRHTSRSPRCARGAPRPAVYPARRRARNFGHIFTRETPRGPQAWATVAAQPVPAWAIDYQTMGKALATSARTSTRHHRASPGEGLELPPQLDDPAAELTPQLIVEAIRDVAFHYFPRRRELIQAIATEPTTQRGALPLPTMPPRRLAGCGGVEPRPPRMGDR